MADSTSVATVAADLPAPGDIERAAAFTREPFVGEGEDHAVALAPGSARRTALDAALAELDAGLEVPSVDWRRRWSLLLGLERLLGQDEPVLVDGTVLSAHQVDALSGTLTALLADVQPGSGSAPLPDLPPEQLASSGIPGAPDVPEELAEEDADDEEPQDWADEAVEDEAQLPEQPEDPNAGKRFWFEHATGAGKTVAALGFVEGSRTGGVLILTHRRNLVDQFHGELRDRGYANRITPPLLRGDDRANGPVTVETYQWFVRNAGNVSDAYTIVICDEAHTALGEKTSAAIRRWAGPIFIGMTATGALIARHVTDLFPTQTSRFDLAQAARRGVISPLRCIRIPPGPGVRTIAKVPLRRGEVDVEFDQEMLAELLDQLPFNLAIADLYKTRFDSLPGVVYAAGVRHAYNVAQAFRDNGLKAQAVSGETPKRELAQILADYERGDIDVLVNAQLLAEGWNSPRATVCMHLAPTASKRIYQQRVGRVTRRHPGKEAGIVVDFVHPATRHDDPVVTLHSLLDRDVYRGGAIVVGPVRRGRGRRLRVERRVLPVTADENRRIEVFERELWRIAVEHLDWGEQVQWAALAGARVQPTGWRRARAMLHFDQGGELKRAFLVTALQRNKHAALRLRALQEIAASRDADAFDDAIEIVGGWPREEKREGVKVVLLALAEKKIGRRDQANNWIWRCAEFTREVHEEYAVQRWPETKRLLGLLVNSSGGAHARNARRLVHSSRQQDRRLSAALLAAAVPHTAEAGEVVNGARTRMSRKPAALARELLRNFPKGKGAKRTRARKRKRTPEEIAALAVAGRMPADIPEWVELPEDEAIAAAEPDDVLFDDALDEPAEADDDGEGADVEVETDVPAEPRKRSRRRRRRRSADPGDAAPLPDEESDAVAEDADSAGAEEDAEPKRGRRRAVRAQAGEPPEAVGVAEAEEPVAPKRGRRRAVRADAAEMDAGAAQAQGDGEPAPKAGRTRTRAAKAKAGETDAGTVPAAAPGRTRSRSAKAAEGEAAPAVPLSLEGDTSASTTTDGAPGSEPAADVKPKRTRRRAAAADTVEPVVAPVEEKPKRGRSRAAADTAERPDAIPDEKPRRSRARAALADAAPSAEASPDEQPKRTRRRVAAGDAVEPDASAESKPRKTRTRATTAVSVESADEAAETQPTRTRTRKPAGAPASRDALDAERPRANASSSRARRSASASDEPPVLRSAPVATDADRSPGQGAAEPRAARARRAPADPGPDGNLAPADASAKPTRPRTRKPVATSPGDGASPEVVASPRARPRAAKKPAPDAADAPAAEAKPKRARSRTTTAAAAADPSGVAEPNPKPTRKRAADGESLSDRATDEAA